ncbi:MAG: hypothetical protein AB1810_11250 [Pseudomonadota bacterium]
MKKSVMAPPVRTMLPLCVAGVLLALPLAATAADQDLRWSVAAGLGYDSNPYRAPGDSYVNYALISQPTVPANEKSGFYLDADAGVDYRLAHSGASSWWLGYDLDFSRYLGSSLSNADVYKHVLSLEWENIFEQKGARERALSARGFFSKVKDIYTDRDDGERDVSGADRSSYDGVGVGVEYKNRLSALKYTVSGSYEVRDYGNAGAAKEYDQNRLVLAGEVSYPLAKKTDISVGYTYKNVDYDKREARRKLDALYSGELLNYVYSTLDVSLRQSVTQQWVMYFDFAYTTRTDEFEGYNDYTKNAFQVRALFSPSDTLDMKFTAGVWQRDYDNAFAFENIDQPKKEYDGLDLDIKAELKRDESSRYWSKLSYTSEDTNDDRYAYDRVQFLVGMAWEFK